ncbi:ferric reductase-like transmembrane domain-containing protein [Herbiconiux sp.]|uniref:ferric reductase-like transmembrane domain-containing protein n=1 Tax=Herbiconiux sp. TaxID=1871186 RepID=UPI0025BEAFFE|nr:ferric reductase-like transmembrane domain-containing protein [Herbiconiux sp.]
MSEVLWAIGRMSGIVSLILFTLSTVLGILTHRGRPLPGLPRFGVVIVHRNVSLLASVFLVLHVATLLGDSYAKLNLVDVVVPFLGSFQPFWQGLGTVAFDLVLAVIITSLLRHRIGDRAFRFVHWFVYAMWPIAVLHSIGNGTDGTSGWFVLILAACLIAVGSAVIWRLSTRSRSPRVMTPVAPGSGRSIR